MLATCARGIQSGFDFLRSRPASTSAKAGSIRLDTTLLEGLPGRRGQHAARGGGRHRADHLLGTLLGVGRFSRNALVRGLCYGYVETFRNIPVLLQLLMWYLLLTEYLPAVDPALHIGKWVREQERLSYPPVWPGPDAGARRRAGVAAASVLYARARAGSSTCTGSRPVFWVSLAWSWAARWAGWPAARPTNGTCRC
jgi:general L-amino acid transport system permease protein